MVGKKPSSCYRKSRKGKSFSGVSAWSGKQDKSLPERDQNIDEQPSTSTSAKETCGQLSTPVSASRQKLVHRGFPSDSSESICSDDENEECITPSYRLVDVNVLSSTMAEVHNCVEGKLDVTENPSARAGLMSEFSISCTECDHSTKMETSPMTVDRGRSFDVNRRAVYHSLETGGGYESLSSFCAIMNMPCMSKQAYSAQVEIILAGQEIEAQTELSKAAEKLHNLMKVENNLNTDVDEENDGESNDEIVDVTVSFDGTWAKRGFTSLFGAFFVMSVDTGEVLDYHILSKFCQKCSLKKNQCKENLEEFDAWKVEHIINGECDINFEGSSPAMEAEAAKVLWSRSIEKHNMRYRFMVSDGDSKAHSAVEDTYEGVKVEKIDCVGHVQKRMGKRLLKLKGSMKGKLKDGKTIGGGRLTEAKIKQLQRYYGLAIRQNILSKPNPTEIEVKVAVYTMKKNIIATLNHNMEAESLAAQHRFCPPGEDSWCKWQQDKATGTKTYKPENLLPPVFLEVLKPVFMALSEETLLGRCVRGATQNRNECINSLVWIRCPKHKFHGAKVIQYAVASAVCHYHGGASSRQQILQRLSSPGGTFTEKDCKTKDKKRVAKSDLQLSDKFKRRREGIAQLKTQREEALREAEGVTYEAGGF